MQDMRQLSRVVQRLLRVGAEDRARRVLGAVHPSDAAFLLRFLRPGEIGALFTSVLPTTVVGEILDELPDRELSTTLGLLRDERIAEILQRLDAPSAARVLARLDGDRREAVAHHLTSRQRTELERILSYPPETAGRLAIPLPVLLQPETTAEECISRLRDLGTEEIWDIYVVTPGGQLVGIVPMRRLLVAPPGTPLREMLVEVPVTVQALDSIEEAARACARYDLMAVPVVDEHHSLVGVITVDDVIDIIEDVATEQLYGIVGLERNLRVQSPMRQQIGSRLPWVIVNLVTASLAALVVGSFEESIAQAAFLAAFMPVIAGMGGNMGTQTLTLVTRGLALGEVSTGKISAILLRQAAVGVLLGIGVGGLTGLGAWLWTNLPRFGVAVFLSLIGNFVLGALIGTLVPVLFQAFDRDPAVGSGVIVTATTDILGFLQFLALAGVLLGLL